MFVRNSAFLASPQFQKGLGDGAAVGSSPLTCCGGGCPFVSFCEAEAYQVGFGQGALGIDGEASNEQSINEFATHVLATNHSQWMPRCKTSAALRHMRPQLVDSGSGNFSTPSRRPFSSLHTDGGEVVVTLRGGLNGSSPPPPSTLPHPANLTIFTGPPIGAKPSGLRLLDEDARRLMNAYGASYGDRTATGQLFLSIDVEGSSGVPPSRWLFVTREAFLVLDPALLAFLTGGLLLPTIKREKVRFADNDCAFGGHAPTDEELSLQHGRIFDHLQRALKSSGYDRGTIRSGSALVRLGRDTFDGSMTNILGGLQYYSYTLDPSTGDSTEQRYMNPAVQSTLGTSLILSASIGVLAAAMGLVIFSKIFHRLQVQLYDEQQAARIITLRRQGITDPAQVIKSDRAAGGEESEHPPANPWLSPFKLLTAIIIQPLRIRLTNSTSKFVRERVMCTTIPNDTRFVYLRTFMERYDFFCMEQHLTAADRGKVQQILIESFNCRIKMLTCDRIFRLRLRGDDEPPLAIVHPDLPTSLPPVSQPGARRDAVVAIVSRFIHERCIVDRAPGSFLDLKDRFGPDGHMKAGFKDELARWCDSLGIDAPAMRRRSWLKALPVECDFCENYKARQVHGLAWPDAGNHTRVKFSWAWYLLEVLAVLLHCTSAFAVPIFVCLHAMVLQDHWGTVLCPPDFGPQPLVWGSANFLSGFSNPVTPLNLHPLMSGTGYAIGASEIGVLGAGDAQGSSSWTSLLPMDGQSLYVSSLASRPQLPTPHRYTPHTMSC